MIIWGQLADSIGATIRFSLAERRATDTTPRLERSVDCFSSDQYLPLQKRCAVNLDHQPSRSFGKLAYLERTGSGQLWMVAEARARLDPERRWYLSPTLLYRHYGSPLPYDLRIDNIAVVADPGSVGLEPVRQLSQKLGEVPTSVACRLPAFDAQLLERAASASRSRGQADEIPIVGMEQDLERRDNQRPLGPVRHGPSVGRILSVR